LFSSHCQSDVDHCLFLQSPIIGICLEKTNKYQAGILTRAAGRGGGTAFQRLLSKHSPREAVLAQAGPNIKASLDKAPCFPPGRRCSDFCPELLIQSTLYFCFLSAETPQRLFVRRSYFFASGCHGEKKWTFSG
jgi:hypothetical protein